MKIFWKMFGLAFAFAVLFAIAFVIWGTGLETTFSHEASVEWFESTRSYAGAIAMGLLVADIVLPIPATGVMTALGAVYGLWLGAAFGAVGSLGAGLLGYAIGRFGGTGLAHKIASEEELQHVHDFFDRWGGWGIIVSRLLPIFPEVLSMMAGLAHMSFRRFFVALVLGTIPTTFLFAYIGHFAHEQPRLGIALALGVPAVLYGFALKYFLKRSPRY
jgi:uncharacterized membrane protein YdjX (TVP38/TMEM64 family)